MTIKARAHGNGYNWNSIGFYLIDSQWPEGATTSVGRSVLFEPGDPRTYREPTFVMDGNEAQALADSLWDAGIRPTQAGATVSAEAATVRHLQDMRAIAFTKLNVEKP